MFALLATLVAPVWAGDVTASAAAGWEAPTRQVWSGVEAALHPMNTDGFAAAGSLAVGWGFEERSPLGLLELGVVRFIASQRGLVRVGLFSRNTIVSLPYDVPLQLTEGDARRFGVVPGFLLHVEFQTGKVVSPFVLTVRAGMQSTVFNIQCSDPGDLTDCGVWDLAFVGGVGIEKRLASGFAFEAIVGPTSKLALGYRF